MTASIGIVGGGFSGAAAALQLLRRSPRPLQVTLVEPRPVPGQGLAYSTSDDQHRLNTTADRHTLDPDDALGFARWVDAQGLVHDDPEARLPDGRIFPRRRDFARFIGANLAAAGPALRHRRATALDAVPSGAGWAVTLDDGGTLAADLLILATGNAPARLPGFVDAAAAGHPGLIVDPFDGREAARPLPPEQRVVVLGSGLTALDVVSTLLAAGHRGPVTVVSRHGLRPRPQPPTAEVMTADSMPFPGPPLPDFVAALGPAPALRRLLRSLRERIADEAAAGRPWQASFGAFRDAVWQLWPALSDTDRRRFLRHLKPMYDVHRYLSPPQNQALMDAAIAAGAVRMRAGRVHRVGVDETGALQLSFVDGTALSADALINCTGLDAGPPRNPLLAALLAAGRLRPGPVGLGFDVDPLTLQAIARDGLQQPSLRLVGPPTLGACGDAIGAAYIALQIRRAVPDMLAALSSP